MPRIIDKNEKLLAPIREKRHIYEPLEQIISQLLASLLYRPLLKDLKRPEAIRNSKEDIIAALQQGHIRYEENGFVGVFSSSVSAELKKLGAVWSTKSPKWLIREEALPTDVRDIVRKVIARDANIKEKLIGTLDAVNVAGVLKAFSPIKSFRFAETNFERDFKRSVKGIAIAPNFSKHVSAKIAEEYTTNLKLYIRKFAEEEIIKLRKEVIAHTFRGDRYEDLITKIEEGYGVARRKAKFLARQETSLLTAKLRDQRYQEIGIEEYIWQTVTGTPAHPVRPMHKKLNGTRQRFDSPPVDDPNGSRHNPGENYNCRCIARPVAAKKS